MFAIIRHGERADKSENCSERKRIEIEFDPHLTQTGHLMAARTGRLLMDLFAQKISEKILDENYEIVLISSPFLRCLQTAAEIMRHTSSKRHNGVLRVEESITEWLNSKWFPSKNSIDELSIHKMGEKRKKELFGDAQIKKNELFEELGLKRPEIGENSMEEAISRIEVFYKKFLEEILAKEDQKPFKRVYVFVSHGFTISGLIQLAEGQRSLREHGWVDYCSTNIGFYDKLKRSKEHWLPVSLDKTFTNFLDHLSDLL